MRHDRGMEFREKISEFAKRTARQNGGKLPVVSRSSLEWEAWRDYRARHGVYNGFFESREKYTVPTEWPPDDIDAEIQAVGGGRLKDKLKV